LLHRNHHVAADGNCAPARGCSSRGPTPIGRGGVSAEARRRQLGDFLRARRRQLVRAELGLRPVAGRSTGLRREEVAVLSGVSATWYAWLEQGRGRHPSRHVLDAIAAAFRLSVAEHSYLLSLAGYLAAQPAEDVIAQTSPEPVLRLLEHLTDLPAYVIAADWQILHWTTAFAAVYPNVATVAEEERNLLWLIFTDPYVREVLPDWELTARHFLAEFRADAGPRLADPPLADLTGKLLEVSPTFRAAWDRHDVIGSAPSERLIHHAVGDLHLERHRARFADPRDMHVVIYTPLSPETCARICHLLGTV
jgi:transcriptional regulator with XRE-family HTH domain